MSVITIIVSALFWTYIDNVKIFENDKIVNSALIHSFFTAGYTNYASIIYPQLIYNYPSIRNIVPPWLITSLFITYGYGFRDMYIGIKHRRIDEIAHATIFLMSFFSAHYYNEIATLTVPFILESSSFFLNLLPLNNEIIDISFFITFAFYRFAVFPIFAYYYCTNYENVGIQPIFIGSIAMTSLNIYWFYLICRKAIRRYKRPKIVN